MITVYSKTNCPHCNDAKRYLESLNINYQEINIEQDDKAKNFVVSQGHRSVPQIYLGHHLLVEGGWQGLKQLNAEDIINRIDNFNLGTL